MYEHQNIPITGIGYDPVNQQHINCDNVTSPGNREVKNGSKIIQLSDAAETMNNSGNYLFKGNEVKNLKGLSVIPFPVKQETQPAATSLQNTVNLFRLFVKNGEYVYARANDIIMMESCDHMVKVYLAINDKIKKTIRHNTLKDFLLQLPQDQFLRIGRFCAVNINRLSGGNCKDQTFEFDFRVSIKLKHALSPAAFGSIGK